MEVSKTLFLPGCTRLAGFSYVPFSRRAWALTHANQMVSSNPDALYFEGEFNAVFKFSESGLRLIQSFAHKNFSAFVRKFLFLGESILILRGVQMPASI